MKLDLGCGKEKRDGYEGVDLMDHPSVDHHFDIGKAEWPIEDNSVEAISSAHVLEHMRDKQVITLLLESYRVLQSGGAIELCVPDLMNVLKSFLDMDFETRWSWGIKTIFGDQSEELQYHINGFDFEKRQFLLEKGGFKNVTGEEAWSHGQPSLLVKAVK